MTFDFTYWLVYGAGCFLLVAAIGAAVERWLRRTREVVICAAIRLPDGRVIRGHRHGDCIRTAAELIDHRHSIGLEPTDYDGLRPEMGPESQGFVTSRNRYVGRTEGLRLQHAAGIPSAARDGYRETQLFSEDLY